MSKADTSPSRAFVWAGLFLVSASAVVILKLSGAIDGTTGLILFACTMAPLALAMRAMQRAQSGCVQNMAITRYNKRMLVSALGYILGLGIATSLHQHFAPGTGLSFALALLPVLPIFGMIFAIARYLIEEEDEYLRYRSVVASLVGLGLVLGLGSFWGFLESFEIVAHAPGWWSVPIWAVGMGLTQAWLSIRDRSTEEEG